MIDRAIRIVKAVSLAAVFTRELIVCSVVVARQVLTMPKLQSAIIAVPISLKTKAGATTLANCVSLTPGTTSLHVSEDLKTLYVHVLHAPDPKQIIHSIRHTFERRIKEIEA